VESPAIVVIGRIVAHRAALQDVINTVSGARSGSAGTCP
jgi:hypothetical protein